MSETENHSGIYYKDEAPKGISHGRYLYAEVVFMIERLMNPERPLKAPRYDEQSEQIIQLKRELANKLDRDGKSKLEQLAEIYLNQSGVLMQIAFSDGFCTAVDLMLDYLEWQASTKYRFTANQQHPPKS